MLLRYFRKTRNKNFGEIKIRVLINLGSLSFCIEESSRIKRWSGGKMYKKNVKYVLGP